jgi:hypothetical protein
MNQSPRTSSCGHEMNPRVGLSEAAVPIKNQERQGIIRVVTMLRQQAAANITLHGHQSKRRLDLVTLHPSSAAAAKIAKAIEDHQARVTFYGVSLSVHTGVTQRSAPAMRSVGSHGQADAEGIH